MDKVKIEEGIANIFSSMVAQANLETMEHEIYKHLMANPELMKHPRHFSHASGFGQIKDAIELAIQHSVKLDPQSAFLHKTVFVNFRNFEAHVRSLVTVFDGSGCCSDKSGQVVGQYLKFLRTGEKAEWNPDNYWIPNFGTQDQWFDYMGSLCHLEHGSPERYFLAYKALMIAGQNEGEIAQYILKQMAEDETEN